MNYKHISSLADLKSISAIEFNVVRKNFVNTQYLDMWVLDFDEKFFETVTQNVICDFFNTFIDQQFESFAKKTIKSSITFYMWFDEQALQLRFNFLKGENVSLPFGCTVNIVDSVELIIQNFFLTVTQVMEGKDYFEECDVLDIDDIDDDIRGYVLNVYVKKFSPYDCD